MKSKTLLRGIRKVNILRLIFPLLVFCFIMLYTFQSSLWEGLFPKELSAKQTLSGAYGAGTRYISTTLSELYYSGYDYMQGSSIRGHYYYTLIDGQCTVYLVKRQEEPPAVLKNYPITGKLVFQKQSLSDLLMLMARDMNWTYEGLSAVTSEVICSACAYHGYIILITGILIFLALSFVLSNIFILLFNILCPDYAYTFAALGHHKNRRKTILHACEEFEYEIIFHDGPLYVTNSYFIYLNTFDAAIVPIDNVMWVYKHSTFYNIGIFSWMAYTLRMVTRDGHKYHFRGNDKAAADTLLKALHILSGDILLGYSPENAAQAKLLIAREKAERKSQKKGAAKAVS